MLAAKSLECAVVNMVVIRGRRFGGERRKNSDRICVMQVAKKNKNPSPFSVIR